MGKKKKRRSSRYRYEGYTILKSSSDNFASRVKVRHSLSKMTADECAAIADEVFGAQIYFAYQDQDTTV